MKKFWKIILIAGTLFFGLGVFFIIISSIQNSKNTMVPISNPPETVPPTKDSNEISLSNDEYLAQILGFTNGLVFFNKIEVNKECFYIWDYEGTLPYEEAEKLNTKNLQICDPSGETYSVFPGVLSRGIADTVEFKNNSIYNLNPEYKESNPIMYQEGVLKKSDILNNPNIILELAEYSMRVVFRFDEQGKINYIYREYDD